jgi:cytochrome P450
MDESKQYADKNPGFYDIPNLKYGWQVMNEAMRLYPPVPVIGRAVVNDEEVGAIY